jgi:hypothetical protein
MKSERSERTDHDTGFDWGATLLIAVLLALVTGVLLVAVLGMLWEAGAF